MKQLPKVDLELHTLFDIANGRIKTELLVTAIELKVFDHLTAPQSSKALAAQLETDPTYTRFLLDGLTAMKLIQKREGSYQNFPDVQIALHSESPTYVGAMFTMMDQAAVSTMTNLKQQIRSGPTKAPADLGDETVWKAYARSMANFQRGGSAQKMAALVSKIDGFEAFGKMLDLGGGPGLFCIAMVAAHPTMQGVIFDQPAVIEVTDSFIAEYEIGDRVTTLAGDYMTDSIGEGYDLIWASATLNFVRSDLPKIIKKIHQALNPGGVFVSLADGATHERTRPEGYVLANMPWMFSGQDIMFDHGEIAEAMKAAGFSSVKSDIVGTPMMPMELDIARKGNHDE